MKPFILLLVAFIVSLFAIKILSNNYDYALAGRIAMSLMLVFTAIGHFIYTKGMAMMLPASLPFKKEAVYITGILEIIAAVGLLVPGMQVWTGWALILFFIVLLPSNIYAAINRVDYQKAGSQGPGIQYLWFRVPLQVLFIAWTYFSAIYFKSFE